MAREASKRSEKTKGARTVGNKKRITKAEKNKEGLIMKYKYGDTFSVDTGKFTGPSPKDKWIVKNLASKS
jgi:ATP-dependent phosphoenolpyruvate carboxykinase